MSPETKKKVDQGIDTIFEKVELTSAKAKDLEKPGPSFEGPISTGKPGPLFQPAIVAQPGDVVHVESDDITGAKGHWMVKVKLGNKIVDVWFETDDRPPLKECDWIKINKTSTSSRGETVYVYIKDYEKTTGPTPKEDHEKTTALTPTPTPTATPTAAPTATPTPTPCKEDETHDLSSETKEFKILDPDGTPIFQCYTNKDSAIAAGNGLSDYFKREDRRQDEETPAARGGHNGRGLVTRLHQRRQPDLGHRARLALENRRGQQRYGGGRSPNQGDQGHVHDLRGLRPRCVGNQKEGTAKMSSTTA